MHCGCGRSRGVGSFSVAANIGSQMALDCVRDTQHAGAWVAMVQFDCFFLLYLLLHNTTMPSHGNAELMARCQRLLLLRARSHTRMTKSCPTAMLVLFGVGAEV